GSGADQAADGDAVVDQIDDTLVVRHAEDVVQGGLLEVEIGQEDAARAAPAGGEGDSRTGAPAGRACARRDDQRDGSQRGGRTADEPVDNSGAGTVLERERHLIGPKTQGKRGEGPGNNGTA